MFERLFLESGLSLDRLKTLVEVGACGGLSKAAGGDPVRQSQYSRQIKELQEYFGVRLVEREGKGLRLTARGRELARISRYFLLGLSSYQRGNRGIVESYRYGGSATAVAEVLMPGLARLKQDGRAVGFSAVTLEDQDVEHGLQELTLDFGLVSRAPVGRPLRSEAIGSWPLRIWVSNKLFESAGPSVAPEVILRRQGVVWVLARELSEVLAGQVTGAGRVGEGASICPSFLAARTVLLHGECATVLPAFLAPPTGAAICIAPGSGLIPEDARITYRLAWNPRLLRLNPGADRVRTLLFRELAQIWSANVAVESV